VRGSPSHAGVWVGPVVGTSCGREAPGWHPEVAEAAASPQRAVCGLGDSAPPAGTQAPRNAGQGHHRVGKWAHSAPRASPAIFSCAAPVDESGVAAGTNPGTAIQFLVDIVRRQTLSDVMIRIYPISVKYEIRIRS